MRKIAVFAVLAVSFAMPAAACEAPNAAWSKANVKAFADMQAHASNPACVTPGEVAAWVDATAAVKAAQKAEKAGRIEAAYKLAQH